MCFSTQQHITDKGPEQMQAWSENDPQYMSPIVWHLAARVKHRSFNQCHLQW